MKAALVIGLRRTVIRCSITTWLLGLAVHTHFFPGIMVWKGYHQ